MSETTHILQILVGEEDLPLLSELGDESEIELEEARPVPPSSDLYFDPGQAIESLFAATGVISGIGGTASVLSWLASKASRRKGTIEVRVGTTRIRIEPGDDPERARALVEDALRP